MLMFMPSHKADNSSLFYFCTKRLKMKKTKRKTLKRWKQFLIFIFEVMKAILKYFLYVLCAN